MSFLFFNCFQEGVLGKPFDLKFFSAPPALMYVCQHLMCLIFITYSFQKKWGMPFLIHTRAEQKQDLLEGSCTSLFWMRPQGFRKKQVCWGFSWRTQERYDSLVLKILGWVHCTYRSNTTLMKPVTTNKQTKNQKHHVAWGRHQSVSQMPETLSALNRSSHFKALGGFCIFKGKTVWVQIAILGTGGEANDTGEI